MWWHIAVGVKLSEIDKENIYERWNPGKEGKIKIVLQ